VVVDSRPRGVTTLLPHSANPLAQPLYFRAPSIALAVMSFFQWLWKLENFQRHSSHCQCIEPFLYKFGPREMAIHHAPRNFFELFHICVRRQINSMNISPMPVCFANRLRDIFRYLSILRTPALRVIHILFSGRWLSSVSRQGQSSSVNNNSVCKTFAWLHLLLRSWIVNYFQDRSKTTYVNQS